MYKYFLPTQIFFGDNAVLENAEALKLGKRAFIVTGKTSGRASGALDDVEKALNFLNIEYMVYDKISNNPTIEECADGAKCARAFKADFIIGIGGGSPLDASKAIAVYTANQPMIGTNFEMMDIYRGEYENKPLPMAAVPTTAGTGSEVTPYSVLTLHSEKSKRTFSSPDTFYKVAFLDGKYILALPIQTLKNTVVDAMSHLIEGYTNKRSSPFTDYIALEGLRLIASRLNNLVRGNIDLDTAKDFIFASTLAGIVITHTGTTVVHSMGYPLTYFKNIPHGIANGLLLGGYLDETEKVLPEKVKNILKAIGISEVKGLKLLLSELLPCDKTFSEEEIDEWVVTTVKAKNALSAPFEATLDREKGIFKQSLLGKYKYQKI